MIGVTTDPATVGNGPSSKELDAALVTHRSTARPSDAGLSNRSERSGSMALLKRSPSDSGGGRSFRAFRPNSVRNLDATNSQQKSSSTSPLSKTGGSCFGPSPRLVPQEEDLTSEETKILLDSFYHFGPIDGKTSLMEFLASVGEPLNEASLKSMLKDVVRSRRRGEQQMSCSLTGPAHLRLEGESHRRASAVDESMVGRPRVISSSSSSCESSEEEGACEGVSITAPSRHRLRAERFTTTRAASPGAQSNTTSTTKAKSSSLSLVDRYLSRHFLQPFFSDRDVLLLLRCIKARMVELSRHQDEAKEVFDALCEEGRQSLDANELRLVTSTFKLTIDVEAYLKEIDEDGSGEVEIGEFRTLLGRVGMAGGGGASGPLSLTARRRMSAAASYAVMSASTNDEEAFDVSLLLPSSGHSPLAAAHVRSQTTATSEGDALVLGKRTARDGATTLLGGGMLTAAAPSSSAALRSDVGGMYSGSGEREVVVVLPSPEGSSLDVPRDDSNEVASPIDSGTFLRTINVRGPLSSNLNYNSFPGVGGGGAAPPSRSMSLVALATTVSQPPGRGLSLSREPTFMLEGPLRAARKTLLESATNPLDAIEAPRVLASYLGLQVRDRGPLTVRMTKKASNMKARTAAAHQQHHHPQPGEHEDTSTVSRHSRRDHLLRLPPLSSPGGASTPPRVSTNSPHRDRDPSNASPASRSPSSKHSTPPSRFKHLPVSLRPDGTREFRVQAGVFPTWREPYALHLQPFPF